MKPSKASLAAFSRACQAQASGPAKGPLSIYLGLPADDGHRLCFWDSLDALMRAPSPHFWRRRTNGGDSLIPRARNHSLWDFYANTADDYLLFIDSDLDFRAEDIHRLIEHRLPIVAGMYAIKQPELRWCINALPGEQPDPKTGLQKVATAGTGLFAVSRAAVGTMIAAAAAERWSKWPVAYRRDHDGVWEWDLFHNGVVDDPEWFANTPRYLSEDWGFCYMARRLGFDVWLDTKCIALHEGAIKYPLQARRLTQAEAEAGVVRQPDGSLTPLSAS